MSAGSTHKTITYRAELRHAILAAAILLFLVLTIGIIVAARFSYVGAISTEQLLRARMAGTQVMSAIMAIDKRLAQFAQMPWGSGVLKGEEQIEIARLQADVPTLISVCVVAANSSIIALQERVSSNNPCLINSDALKLAFSTRKPQTGLVLSDNSPIREVLMPEANVNGSVTVYRMSLIWLSDLLRTLSIAEVETVSLSNAQGKLIAHPDVSHLNADAGLKSIQTKVETSLLEPLLRTLVGEVKQNIDGRWRLSKTASPPNTDWTISVERDLLNVSQPYLNLVAVVLLLAVLFIFLMLIWARRVSNRLTGQFLLLSEGAGKIAAGHLEARVDVQSPAEFAELSSSFNTMAAQLQDYTQNLEQKVRNKTQQLELANQHKSEFLANMSHELRTPLSAVIGFSDALREEYFGQLNDKQHEYVGDIAASGQHLLSLINDILDLSKIESGMMDLSPTYFSVAEAIDNALVLIRERAIRQGLALTSEIGDGVDLLYADERKFKQVLINLLTNAVKFTYPNGWVKIRAEIVPTNAGANLQVSVADSGLGIAKEDFDTVFQEFRQLTTEGEAKHEGTGLGLSLAKRIVELHGGRIWLESELGKGATFLFVMPLEGER